MNWLKEDNRGYLRIQGELLKLGIKLDKITIRYILFDFRRKEKVKKEITWKQFLKNHIKSIYAMDFFFLIQGDLDTEAL